MGTKKYRCSASETGAYDGITTNTKLLPIFFEALMSLLFVGAHELAGPWVFDYRLGGKAMKKIELTAILLFAVVSLSAKDRPAYEKGVLAQMDSATCGFAEKDGKTIAGEIFGTDGQHKKTQQTLCQEYILRGERVIYRIRPKDDKHPALLPIGETAEFRIHKDKLLLRVPEAGDKEREYIVVSMTPRADEGETKPASLRARQ
jgi:hypothetical protein